MCPHLMLYASLLGLIPLESSPTVVPGASANIYQQSLAILLPGKFFMARV